MNARQLIENEADDKDELLAGAPTHYIIRGTGRDQSAAYVRYFSGLNQWIWTRHREEATPFTAEEVNKFKEFMERDILVHGYWALDLVAV